MLTITVGALLIGLAVPAFDGLLRSNRLTTEANRLVSAMHYAKTEATRLRTAVTLQALGGDWTNGAEAIANPRPFQDLNRDGDFLDADESSPAVPTQLRVFPALGENSVIGPDGVATVITFQPSGFVSTGDVGLQLCDAGSAICRLISVSGSGRIAASEFHVVVEDP